MCVCVGGGGGRESISLNMYLNVHVGGGTCSN